jgi:hypothetical protein
MKCCNAKNYCDNTISGGASSNWRVTTITIKMCGKQAAMVSRNTAMGRILEADSYVIDIETKVLIPFIVMVVIALDELG